jgi:hypothetical protein
MRARPGVGGPVPADALAAALVRGSEAGLQRPSSRSPLALTLRLHPRPHNPP